MQIQRQKFGEMKKESLFKNYTIFKHPKKNNPANFYKTRTVSVCIHSFLSVLERICPLNHSWLQHHPPGRPPHKPRDGLSVVTSQTIHYWVCVHPSLLLMPTFLLRSLGPGPQVLAAQAAPSHLPALAAFTLSKWESELVSTFLLLNSLAKCLSKPARYNFSAYPCLRLADLHPLLPPGSGSE